MTIMTLTQLADKLGGTVHYPAGYLPADKSQTNTIEIHGIAAVDRAGPGDVTFLINPEYMKFAATTTAAAVIVSKVIPDCPRPQIIHSNPYWAFAKTSQEFAPKREETGTISSLAFIDPTAQIGRNVTVYPMAYVSAKVIVKDHAVLFPGVYLGERAEIGEATVLRSNVVVEDGCVIGNRVLIHANTVIGADGFGFAPGTDDIAKIPQVGIVRVLDDVEIGAGSTIDRAAMGETVIGHGCKLDSSVHVAHNVRMGDHTMMCGGALIAGSAKIGKWNILAGSSNINNHVVLSDRVTIGALAGVTKSINEPGEYMGFPAMPAGEWRRQIASMRRMKELSDRVRKLEQLLEKSSDPR